VISVPQKALDVADLTDFRLEGLKSPDGLAILQLVNSLHLSFLSCLAAETERICKSAPEIKGLGDARLWFQALLLTKNREEPVQFDSQLQICVAHDRMSPFSKKRKMVSFESA
jgi:hypothetical protein